MGILTDRKNGTSKETYAYTPGLKAKRVMDVRKTRNLPIPGDILVKVGDDVSWDSVVARAFISGDPYILKISVTLGVETYEVNNYMLKDKGDKVSEGEEIARFKALFGLINRSIKSPISGTIESISEATGQVIIRGSPLPLEINAYIPGKVVTVIPQKSVIIQTNAAVIQGILGVGGETHGKLRIAVDSPSEQLTADRISANDRGNVIIGGSLVTSEALRKAVDIGVSGIVVGGIRHQDLVDFTGEMIGVAITGHEDLGLSLIITEGFGEMPMSQRSFKLLNDFDGCIVALNGTTQIRAGVIRPEIIIPHEEILQDISSDKLETGMATGTPVRIIRKPYFGSIGSVYRLPVELEKVKTESYVRVLEVELEDGRIVLVPRANVEIIEE